MYAYEPIGCVSCGRFSKNEHDELIHFAECDYCGGWVCSKCMTEEGLAAHCDDCAALMRAIRENDAQKRHKS